MVVLHITLRIARTVPYAESRQRFSPAFPTGRSEALAPGNL
jgi:hypothetical protein